MALKAFSLNLDGVCRNASEVDQRELKSFFLMLLKVLNRQTHSYEREVCKAFFSAGNQTALTSVKISLRVTSWH